MKKYDVIIVGAGPGGIFSAYELVTNNSEVKVAVFEKGHLLEKRKCPIDGEKVKSCINCKRCSIMCGFGGAGAFSESIKSAGLLCECRSVFLRFKQDGSCLLYTSPSPRDCS